MVTMMTNVALTFDLTAVATLSFLIIVYFPNLVVVHFLRCCCCLVTDRISCVRVRLCGKKGVDIVDLYFYNFSSITITTPTTTTAAKSGYRSTVHVSTVQDAQTCTRANSRIQTSHTQSQNHTDTLTHKQTHKHTNTPTHKHTNTQTHKQTHEQTNKQTNTHTNKQTNKHTHKQTNTHTQPHTQTNKHTIKHTRNAYK